MVVFGKRCIGNRLVHISPSFVLGDEMRRFIFRLSSTYNNPAQCRLGVHSHRIGWTDDGINQKEEAKEGELVYEQNPRAKSTKKRNIIHASRKRRRTVTLTYLRQG
jgi:hypothetical protein